MLQKRLLAALLGLPTLFILFFLNFLFRWHGGSAMTPLSSWRTDDLFLLLLVLIIVCVSGWEVSGIVRRRFSKTVPWNGVYAALIIPFLIHSVRPIIAGQSIPSVSSLGLLIDSIGATATVMLLFLGIWGDVENRGKEGLWENIYVVGISLFIGLTTSFVLLLGETQFHEMAAVYIIVVVFALDTFAYFGGKFIGGPRMIPSISPNKTWAGSVIGLLVGSLFSLLFSVLPGLPNSERLGSVIPWWGLLIMGVGIGVFGQIGDLLESAFKRWGGVKDSGQALPGHGGFLDRFDSFFLAAPVCYLLLLVFSNMR